MITSDLAKSLMVTSLASPGVAFADGGAKFGFQTPQTIIAHQIYDLHFIVLGIVAVIAVVVFAVMDQPRVARALHPRSGDGLAHLYAMRLVRHCDSGKRSGAVQQAGRPLVSLGDGLVHLFGSDILRRIFRRALLHGARRASRAATTSRPSRFARARSKRWKVFVPECQCSSTGADPMWSSWARLRRRSLAQSKAAWKAQPSGVPSAPSGAPCRPSASRRIRSCNTRPS